MSDSNTTDFTNPSTFILLGIPGLEADHVSISIPFCTIYAIAILGNLTILFIGDRFQCLPHPDVLHSQLLSNGIWDPVALAFDRYVAICDPLRHSTILTNAVVAKIGLAMVLRSSMLLMPNPILESWWPYCRTNIIPQTYCEGIAVVKLA
ncbi:unnamed protein product [Caretta caretta]